ncbi:MAG: methyltransferase domain-containing protein [Thermoanaerobaculales bacterium]
MTAKTSTRRQVQQYYSRVLSNSRDLKTNACCPLGDVASEVVEILELIEPEILERFYGCGSPIPPAVEGRTVLDLGCGTGRDAFLCSKLVGETGRVIGIDMTAEQLAVGRRHLKSQMLRFRSTTVRAFKLASLEDRCEDYGQIARYLGTIPGAPHAFHLDDHHEFATGKPTAVCGNTAAMLSETRFGENFQVEGDREVHYGLFDCGSSPSEEGPPAGCC